MVVIADEHLVDELIAERREKGLDRYDEVWDGDYFMSPLASDRHQQLANRLATVFTTVVEWPGDGHVRQGVNVSDRRDDWMRNYRIPDVAVFLNDTSAVNCESHWFGGPDFAVEIVSPNDRTREKVPFYAAVGTRELLIIERVPWRLELLRLNGAELQSVAMATADDGAVSSDVLPFTFHLKEGSSLTLVVTHSQNGEEWVM